MEITKNIHILKIPFLINLSPGKSIERFVNVYLITGRKIYLIDTGVKGSEQKIFEYIKSLGRNPGDIAGVFLTHAHPDHIGALKSVKKVSGCEVFVHKNEVNWVEDIDKQHNERPVPGFYNLVEGSVSVDNVVKHNDQFNPESGMTIKAIHTPGHSEGSVCYYFNEMKTLFTGDVIFLPGELPIYTSYVKCIESLKKLGREKDIKLLLSAWDNPCLGDCVNEKIEESIHYLEMIDVYISDLSSDFDPADPISFCKKVLLKLNIPEFLANPLLLKSFISHLNI